MGFPTMTVIEDRGFITPGILKGIGKDRHPVESFLVVDAGGEGLNSCGQPGRISSGMTKRVADQAPQEQRSRLIGIRCVEES